MYTVPLTSTNEIFSAHIKTNDLLSNAIKNLEKKSENNSSIYIPGPWAELVDFFADFLWTSAISIGQAENEWGLPEPDRIKWGLDF